MKEYQLNEPLTTEFFKYLGYFGKVKMIPNLMGGFYSFEKTDWFSIKGFIGDTTVEVKFKQESMDMTSDFLFYLFSAYQKDEVDMKILKQREQSLSERVKVHLYGK
ncbi:MAG TPA: hypothetical protein O0W81_03425 [Methanocorpusculum sp.]|nr:hypothetical protein [Methanocorpusculum sp.]HJJ90795.1 hypothetical protein [Methanocorpusculum sp.]HJK01364.1 hypothetical protein [Methanocorpusculum sp.]HJK02421.1 hypothetical protein [Methanocorpusculum sp.]